MKLYLPNHEGGNAVTLTLLGLAVAIFAGVVVLYFIGRSTPQPIYMPEPVAEKTQEEEVTKEPDPREGWRVYNNEMYDFHLEYPEGWAVATGTLETGDPVVTVYPAMLESTSSVYSHQDQATHVSVYPNGVATEGIAGEMESSDIIITIPGASAKDYLLRGGKVWATRVQFDKVPESWNAAGFVFARTYVEEEELFYMRGDTEIYQEQFDPVTGDHIERSGFIDVKVRAVQEEILRGFAFGQYIEEVDVPDEEQATTTATTTEEVPTLDAALLIQVETPLDGVLVESPLLVRGEARGQWYFEGDFPVRLEAADGTALAEVPAPAQDEWMTEEFVPFEVSIVFDPGTATSGQLVLVRDNPSGLPENDAELVIPLYFVDPELSLEGE